MRPQRLRDEKEPVRSSEAQYRHELLTQCPRLPDEQYPEEARRIRLARAGVLTPEEGEAAKQWVVQGYLWLVRALAYRWARRTNFCVDVLDLIQVGNIGLIVGVEAFSYEGEYEYPAMALVKYLCKRIAGEMVRAIYDMGFSMCLPEKRKLQEEQWDTLRQPARGLDDCDEMGIPVRETLLAPELILSSDPDVCPAHKAYFLALLLTELPFRQRQVLQLRYGLGEDGRCSTSVEIAALLGVTATVVYYHERQAIERVQSIYATYEQETGRTSTSLSYDEDMHAYLERRRRERAQEPHPQTTIVNARLYEAFTSMQERSDHITGDTLAQVAGTGEDTALRFLRQRGYSTPRQRFQDVADHLECTFTKMQERGEPITHRTLAQAADVHEGVVRPFMQKRGYNALHIRAQERTDRLEQAFARSQEQGIKMSRQRLKDASGVSECAAGLFLKQKRQQLSTSAEGGEKL